jgi:uridylate kinase
MSRVENRFLVKVSGEALMGGREFGLDMETVARIAADLAAAAAEGRQIAVVVGGGNIFRGLRGLASGVERTTGDAMGRLATVINALAMAGAITAAGRPAVAMSAEAMPSICPTYTRRDALAALARGEIVVLAGGVGTPFFTTDSGAALRAAELDCAALLKATNVDGVYTADPRKDPAATRFDTLSHAEAIRRDLGVMDTAAFALARENALPIFVFAIHEPGAIRSVLAGQGRFTRVMPDR